jgi:hypothetical protein
MEERQALIECVDAKNADLQAGALALAALQAQLDEAELARCSAVERNMQLERSLQSMRMEMDTTRSRWPPHEADAVTPFEENGPRQAALEVALPSAEARALNLEFQLGEASSLLNTLHMKVAVAEQQRLALVREKGEASCAHDAAHSKAQETIWQLEMELEQAHVEVERGLRLRMALEREKAAALSKVQELDWASKQLPLSSVSRASKQRGLVRDVLLDASSSRHSLQVALSPFNQTARQKTRSRVSRPDITVRSFSLSGDKSAALRLPNESCVPKQDATASPMLRRTLFQQRSDTSSELVASVDLHHVGKWKSPEPSAAEIEESPQLLPHGSPRHAETVSNVRILRQQLDETTAQLKATQGELERCKVQVSENHRLKMEV